MTASPSIGGGSAKPNRYGNVWIFGFAGITLLPLCVWELLKGGGADQVMSSVLLLILSIACFPLAAYSGCRRLDWSRDFIAIRVGPLRREVSLSTLQAIRYRHSGRVGVYVVEDGSGRNLTIDATLYRSDDVWKPLLLATADRVGATVDPKARLSLGVFDGSGRGYLP